MHRMGKGLGWLGTLLLVALGCKPTETRIQPPPLHEEYTLPPADDARFSAPPTFPKDSRDSTRLNRGIDSPNGLPSSIRGPAGPGGRMGGPGMGGPGMGGY